MLEAKAKEAAVMEYQQILKYVYEK
jgi:hypothetical protein